MLLPTLLPSVYTALAVSLTLTVLLVLTRQWHGRFSLDDTHGIQKQHRVPTPRIGGVAIVLGVLAGWAVAKPERQVILGPMLLAGLPAFAFGLAEDLTKKVSIMARLLATMVSGVLAWCITGVSITSLDVPVLDTLLGLTLFSVVFTAFAVGGVANAINILDGFNGQASGFVILALIGLALMATASQDSNLALACLCLAAAVLGFWLVNWPWGKIFLGDGGSYFGGFALAWFCVMLVERNPEITAFAPLLVCIHPVTEVLFSIYRRRLRSAHPGHPDRLHLHSLLMRRLVRPWLTRVLKGQVTARKHANAVTGLLVACMSLPPVTVSFLLQDYTLWTAFACLCFMVGYITMYARLVRMQWRRQVQMHSSKITR